MRGGPSFSGDSFEGDAVSDEVIRWTLCILTFRIQDLSKQQRPPSQFEIRQIYQVTAPSSRYCCWNLSVANASEAFYQLADPAKVGLHSISYPQGTYDRIQRSLRATTGDEWSRSSKKDSTCSHSETIRL